MKKKLSVILFIVLLFLVLLCGGIFCSIQFLSQPIDSSKIELVDFEVKNGMTAKSVGKELKEQGLIKDDTVFYFFARFPKVASIFFRKPQEIFKIQTGYYELSKSMNLATIFQELSSGKEKSIDISIPEGLTISKIAERLRKAGLKNLADFEQVALNDGKKIFYEHELNISANSVEGFLFPDTYKIPISYNSEKVISMMIENLLKHISTLNKTFKIQNMSDIDGQIFYQTMILASIVEREYRVKDEARLIASVFKNRLQINMPLQSCATVEYIITEIDHKPHPKIIYFSDLESSSSYNTYKYSGLPPTPISNPGITAIEAALNPQNSDYLYFTLTDSDSGRHTFSKNLGGHIQATNEFRTKRDANN